jgi:hypothetical protein
MTALHTCQFCSVFLVDSNEMLNQLSMACLKKQMFWRLFDFQITESERLQSEYRGKGRS